MISIGVAQLMTYIDRLMLMFYSIHLTHFQVILWVIMRLHITLLTQVGDVGALSDKPNQCLSC